MPANETAHIPTRCDCRNIRHRFPAFGSAEVVRAYRENTEVDPWNEYASEEAPAKPFDWERWKSIDELNAERKAKNEFYNREEIDTQDDDI